jgi:hypothetical protein
LLHRFIVHSAMSEYGRPAPPQMGSPELALVTISWWGRHR